MQCTVSPMQPSDIDDIVALCRRVYPSSPPWTATQLLSHLEIFAEGQQVARTADGALAGMSASLIVRWDAYDALGTWRDFTSAGTFRDHDVASGRTLYGAEIMVEPSVQGTGVGSALYRARRELAETLGLLRIRAGARLAGYGAAHEQLTPWEYVLDVVSDRRRDPTLSFQLSRGFHVFDVVHGYLEHDPASRGWAALIQWVNPAVATRSDYGVADPRLVPFMAPSPARLSADGLPSGADGTRCS